MKFVAKPIRHATGNAVELIDESGYPNIVYAFSQIKQLAASVFPELRDARLVIGCPHQLGKHSHHQIKDSDRSGRNWRAFAHTVHFPNTVCIHPHAENELPLKHLIPMMSHEFGHLIAEVLKAKNSQKQADRLSEKYLGIGIKYTTPARLQTAK